MKGWELLVYQVVILLIIIRKQIDSIVYDEVKSELNIELSFIRDFI